MNPVTGPRPSDRFIPWYIVLFFVAQTALFGWLYHVADKTHTGLVTEGAYEKGLKYNGVIEKSAAQDRLGWTSSVLQKDGGVAFVLKDREGRPLSGAAVRLWLVRPVHDGDDLKMEMKEASPGNYFAAAAVPEKGLWEIRIRAEMPQGNYQVSERIVFK